MDRFHRLLICLYPASFRAEYADELRHVVSERRLRVSGPLAVGGLWVDVLTDTLIAATGAHWDLLRQDLSYARRALTKSPGFALTAVAVAALGIGAATAVFTVTDHALFRPLPFRDAERLVKLWENVPRYSRVELSPANYRDWRREATSFETMAAFHSYSVNLVGEGDPLRLDATAATGELFPMLGVEPIQGRYLDLEDDRPGASPAAVLSYGLWQSVFGGKPVVGRALRLDDTVHHVIGVMPPYFYFPNRNTDVWTSERFTEVDFEDRDNNYLQSVARLATGVSIGQARSEMAVVTDGLAREYPVANRETSASVPLLRDEISSQARLLLAGLVGASICVLLIACTNLASLLLARAMERYRELTIRTAMGAGRERLLRQLLTESLLLASLGGALGVVVATVAVPLLARLVPTYLPLSDPTVVDSRVLLFAAIVTGATGIAFGVVPALRSFRGVDASGLREGSRAGVGARRQGLRTVLVAAQLTASVVLLVVSGLLIRALSRVQAVEPGFRTEDVVAVSTPMPFAKYATTSRRAAFYARVLEEVTALPGVVNAAFVSFLPMKMSGGIWPVILPDAPETTGTSETASLRFVTPGFFSTMGIPLRSGRDVTEVDSPDAPFVAVVSESFVRRYWPNEEPLGKRFELAFREREVVGVVGDIRVRGLERMSEPQVYLPHRQVPDGGLIFYMPKELVMRVSGAGEVAVAATREILRRADPELPIGDVQTLADVVGGQTAPRRTQVWVLGAFTILSSTLSGVGIYGLLAFTVSRRRNEFGLRIALGAPSSDILRRVVQEAAGLGVAGCALGAVVAYVAARGLQGLLFGVEPSDGVTYAVAIVLGLSMTLAGCLVPALRAARVHPSEALRAE